MTKLDKIIHEVSKELQLPEEVVSEVYKSFWKLIKLKIESLPLKEELSSEDFEKLITNFNIPSLGKLSCDYSRYFNIKEKNTNKYNGRIQNEVAKGDL